MKRDYVEFQDRSIPIGYFITFRTFGSWLHGDKRGSMDRRSFNRFGGSARPPNESLRKSDLKMSRSSAFRMNKRQRQITESAIAQVCTYMTVALYALNARSNHVHVVVSCAGYKPEKLMTAFKAYSTRALRSAGVVSGSDKLWSRHGSTKYLWTAEQINEAVAYVKYEQGEN